MRRLLCEYVLVNGGWLRRMAIDVAPDGSIAAVEPAAANDEGERLSGWVLPGLIDVHSRAADYALAGLLEPGGFAASPESGSGRLRAALLARIGPEELWAIAAALYVELLRAGCTSVVAFHELHHAPDGAPYDDPALLAVALHEAAREAGIGLTLLPAVRSTADWDGRPLDGPFRRAYLSADGFLRLWQRLERLFGDDPARRPGLALSFLAGVPAGRIAEFVELIEGLDPHAPIHVRLAEHAGDPARCRALHGCGPLELLTRPIEPDSRWCLLHAAALDGAERERLRGSEAVVGLTPATEGCRLGALAELLDTVARPAIGTDGGVPADPVAALHLTRWARVATAGAGRRIADADADLLARTLAGGAQASGRAIGRIAPGFRADLVHLDPDHPLLAGASPEQVVGIWLRVPGRRPFVRDVMVDGIWQVRDGRHVAEERAFEGLRHARGRILRDRM